MTQAELIAKLKWFATEAVCPVAESCRDGFVSGAYWGWGEARNLIYKWIKDVELPTNNLDPSNLPYVLECKDCLEYVRGQDHLDAQSSADTRGWKTFDDGWVCPICSAERLQPAKSNAEPYYDDRHHQMKRS